MSKKILIAAIVLLPLLGMAQTDIDAIMMEKKALCVGPMYSYSSWKNYWEGTLKRDNENLGTVSTQMIGVMGTYGVSKKLNVLFGAPYVITKASAGTLHGQKGIQDLSLFVKYVPYRKKLGDGIFTLFAIGGFSTPLTNYVADFLPMSIGLHTSNLLARGMVDYQVNNLFVTGSATYVYRSNIKIDRTSYYTTEMHYTDEVEMPDMASYNVRTGIRTFRYVAEAFFQQNYTLGGFDIRRNDMPFPSNRMDASIVGVHFKYVLKKLPNLSMEAGGSYVVKGRNIGQATEFNGSVFYIIPFGHSKVSPSKSCKLCGIR